MLEIVDAFGQVRTDLDDAALLRGIEHCDPDLVAGALNEMVLNWTGEAETRLFFHHARDDRYMVTHVDAAGQGRTAIADGDPAETVRIGIGGEPEDWPGDHFVAPPVAAALAERFLVEGGRDPTVEWRPSTAHL